MANDFKDRPLELLSIKPDCDDALLSYREALVAPGAIALQAQALGDGADQLSDPVVRIVTGRG